MKMETYLYPQNLRATAKIWLWSLMDFTVIGISTLVSVLILVNIAVFVPCVVVMIYAFVTIRLEDVTIMDFIRYAVKFFISTQQYFEWRGKRIEN